MSRALTRMAASNGLACLPLAHLRRARGRALRPVTALKWTHVVCAARAESDARETGPNCTALTLLGGSNGGLFGRTDLDQNSKPLRSSCVGAGLGASRRSALRGSTNRSPEKSELSSSLTSYVRSTGRRNPEIRRDLGRHHITLLGRAGRGMLAWHSAHRSRVRRRFGFIHYDAESPYR
jgi:hypothetical protein